MEIINLTDGYKLDHRRQYPEGTEYVYSNWTPRSFKLKPEAKEGVVVFGIQYLIKEYFIDQFNKNFFNLPKEQAVKSFKRRVDSFLGPNNVGTEHIEALHDLGYLPIRVKALPEGTLCPFRVPCMTIRNTDPKFFWITNFLETLISCTLWLPMTTATTARLFKKNLIKHARKTGWEDGFLGFSCHDFSMRGMAGYEAALMSGMAWLTSWNGSETIPAHEGVEYYYNADPDQELISATIPATEHSVMCAGGMEDELGTFKRLINEVYPSGMVSIVSDTWDFWKVITEYLPALKEDIIRRDGRVVIRPDSGDPVRIICGYDIDDFDTEQERMDFIKENGVAVYKGAYQMLAETFGYTVNKKGYKELDSHIGLIYGDSITLLRQKEIYTRLEAKGFAATNLCLGVGSYSLQYATRDTHGFAQKATWCQINGVPTPIFKDPKTDNGVKKSLKGLIKVEKTPKGLVAVDEVSMDEEHEGCLETVFHNGKLMRDYSLQDIRNRVNESL